MKDAEAKEQQIAAQYATRIKQVVVSPATVRLLDVSTPCTTPNDGSVVGSGPSKLAGGRSCYQTIIKQIVATAATTREIVIPAQYAIRTKQVLVSAASTKVIETPAQYAARTRQVVGSVAATREIEIPAEFKTITKTVVKSPAKTTETTIPAEYGSYTTTAQTSGNSYAEWQEILCDQNLTAAMIIQIQKALKAKGYDPGPIDDIIGTRTKAAILQFQKDKNLATGNYRSIETLKALEVMN